jgi:hypothetical protein
MDVECLEGILPGAQINQPTLADAPLTVLSFILYWRGRSAGTSRS